MTSKNLSFKLMKEDTKRRIWLISLLALSFFFGVIVPMMFQISVSAENFESVAAQMTYIQRGARRILECSNGIAPVILVIASAVCGISGFSYLYSAKKTDLYHSIPAKRWQLFLAHFANGILIPGICFLVSQVIAAVMAATAGVPLREGIGLAMSGWAFHMSYYILMYTVMVIAVMMTGNLVISLLGCLVFQFYIPGIALLCSGYVQMFFFTYHNTGEEFWNNMLYYGSPLLNYVYEHEQLLNGDANRAVIAAAVLAISAVFAVIAWQLYEKRPSEAAGKAMAFRISQAPIRILLDIPISLSFAIFFIGLRDSLVWGIFGLICGAVLTHCLIEIIYHFDFRKLFSKKLHLACCMVASLLIFCGFRFDWFGYDSYLPPADQVEYVSMTCNDLNGWVTYGNVEKREYSDGAVEYHWKYADDFDYASEHMKITELEPVLALAEQGIQDQEYGEYFYQIQYHLKNGNVVNRDYYTNAEGAKENLEKIFDMPEYKYGAYPILIQTSEETARVRFQQYNQMQEVTRDETETAMLLQAYQEDLLALTSETMKKELPIGTVQFMTKEMDDVLFDYRETVSDMEYEEHVYGVEERCYYPVYPSFEKTLELLEKFGVKVQTLGAERVDRIEVVQYDEEKFTETENVYTEKEELEALIPALIPSDYYGMNSFYEAEFSNGFMAHVQLKGEDSRKTIRCDLDDSKIPDFLN